MSIQITHWLRAFLAVQEAAFDGRGETAILDGDDVVERWPRTSGDDAIAIAAVVDPIVRRDEAPTVATFWRPLAEDLTRYAIADGARVYRRNETFWKTLLITCVELHATGRALPPVAQLDALIAQLLAPPRLPPHRNGTLPPDGPFKHFDGVKSFDDLYNAQFIYLRDLRGSDLVDPEAGMRGDNRAIPRTTNADVIALAEFWDKQFAASRSVIGKREAIAAMWTAAMADVNAVARVTDPNAVYPKNNGFWRAMKEAAIYVAVADDAPTDWDLAKEAIKDSVTHLPENLEAGASAAAKFVGGLAHEVGKVANEAGKGLLSGFGTPLLIGAGLLGLFVISRKRAHDDTKKAGA